MVRRLPAMLKAVCGGSLALHFSVLFSLDAAILRGFELVRLCPASQATPGYVALLRADGEHDVMEEVGVDVLLRRET